MKAQVYRFKMEYVGFEDKINRVVDISSNSSMAKLGYALLAAFDTFAYHLFFMKYKGQRYEIRFEGDDFYLPAINPIEVKLKELNLQPGDKIEMIYDYGCDQKFMITFEGSSEMEKGSSCLYPKIVSGAGRGILDDVSPYEFGEIIYAIDRNEELDDEYLSVLEDDWDYRDFDVDTANLSFRYIIGLIKKGYESDGLV